ncbi:MAG TPA: glycoside hydrolase family 95 protein [Bryobacteraceae bacterium]|nr:glycoside hydrolase family 95 protein [Bryobacteraceae bacterium]
MTKIIAVALVGAASFAAAADVLWYRQEAANWNEALPIGNGRLGGMVFGGLADHIQLNEDTVWAGETRDRNNPEAAKSLPEVRRLLFAGMPHEAEVLADKTMISIPRRLPPYQTMGDLRIGFASQGEISGYRRELDLDTGVVRVTYHARNRDSVTGAWEDANYTREYFSSAPDQVIVVRLTCDKPHHINIGTGLSRQPDTSHVGALVDSKTRFVGGDRVALDGEAIARDSRHDQERPVGVKFQTVLLVTQEGGEISQEKKWTELTVLDANSVTLFLATSTSFKPRDIEHDLLAAKRPYAELKARHIADYQRLFERVKLSLGTAAAPDLPTDERIKRVAAGSEDLRLVEQYFQFGRYLLISCSRPGAMAATLQGLWNDKLDPSWDSKYTININTEMNYWPAEVTNLSELHEPLFDLIDLARPDGRRVAKAIYGARGFVLHHNTDIWGDAVPIDGVGSGIWPMGGAWLSLHEWDHYDFTRDKNFLASRGYPVMKEAAEFLLDYLVDDGKGHLVTGPSISPENTYVLPNGVAAKLCMGPYMDTEIARQLFTRVIDASTILSIDADFRAKVKTAMDRLPPFQIGKYGQLQEWMQDYDEKEPGHRHVSQLFALHPGNQITPRGTPELAKAARATLERRLANGGGHTGWSRAWIINFWARLEDGDKAGENVMALLGKSTLPNMLDTHPPFQIDGNFGGTAGIAEMLLQSHAGEISILPALPKSWSTGSVKGLHARGAIEVDIDWKDGKASRVALRSPLAGGHKVRFADGRVENVKLAAGKETVLR